MEIDSLGEHDPSLLPTVFGKRCRADRLYSSSIRITRCCAAPAPKLTGNMARCPRRRHELLVMHNLVCNLELNLRPIGQVFYLFGNVARETN